MAIILLLPQPCSEFHEPAKVLVTNGLESDYLLNLGAQASRAGSLIANFALSVYLNYIFLFAALITFLQHHFFLPGNPSHKNVAKKAAISTRRAMSTTAAEGMSQVQQLCRSVAFCSSSVVHECLW